MQTLAWAETHTDAGLCKVFIEPRASPGAPPGRAVLHLAALRSILLQESMELGAGSPLAGTPAQTLRGHLLDPAVRVQQVLGSAGAKGHQPGSGRAGGSEPMAPGPWHLKSRAWCWGSSPSGGVRAAGDPGPSELTVP